ncbi:hypothetical protein BCON_0016g00180 [Botryotinia convoluta]|uniref:Uncharacterized protein n=1 Tax=Botryotinia convoluta TaxID=54673 RepID=A0A4Z1INM2_9HELO|nr:hypothetical protein BCON_0016g00180 [Botryotinia convoluta]
MGITTYIWGRLLVIGQDLEVNFVVIRLHIEQAVNKCFLGNQDGFDILNLGESIKAGEWLSTNFRPICLHLSHYWARNTPQLESGHGDRAHSERATYWYLGQTK